MQQNSLFTEIHFCVCICVHACMCVMFSLSHGLSAILQENTPLQKPIFLRFVELLYYYFLKFYLFIFGCAGFLLLCGLFSSCEQGLLSNCSAWASYCSGFYCCGAWALECAGFSSCNSQALEHRLNSVAHGLSCSMVYGIFLDKAGLCITEPPEKP